MKWNLLKEQKPEMGYNKSMNLIVTTKWGGVNVYGVVRDGYGNIHWNASITYEGKYSFECEISEDDIKAWMYMPEPYEEEEEGDEEW